MALRNARSRILLTGTPVQNKIEELGSILNIVTGGKFHSNKEFREHFVVPMKRGASKRACPEAKALMKRRMRELRKLLEEGFMMRRLKEEVQYI